MKKGQKTGEALGKHVISLYTTRISHVVKTRYIKKLQQDIDNNMIIKDQMATLGCLLVFTFDNFLVPVSVAVHRISNLDLRHEQGFENKGYKSD